MQFDTTTHPPRVFDSSLSGVRYVVAEVLDAPNEDRRFAVFTGSRFSEQLHRIQAEQIGDYREDSEHHTPGALSIEIGLNNAIFLTWYAEDEGLGDSAWITSGPGNGITAHEVTDSVSLTLNEQSCAVEDLSLELGHGGGLAD